MIPSPFPNAKPFSPPVGAGNEDADEIAIASSGTSSTTDNVPPLPRDRFNDNVFHDDDPLNDDDPLDDDDFLDDDDDDDLVSADSNESLYSVDESSDIQADQQMDGLVINSYQWNSLWRTIISNSYFYSSDEEQQSNDDTDTEREETQAIMDSICSDHALRPKPSLLHYRHQIRRPRPAPLNEGEQENVLIPVERNELQEALGNGFGNLNEVQLFKQALFYVTVPALITAVPLSLVAFLYFVVLPVLGSVAATIWEKYLAPIAFLVVIRYFVRFCSRSDFQAAQSTTLIITMEKQIVHLSAICCLFPAVIFLQKPLGAKTLQPEQLSVFLLTSFLKILIVTITILFGLDILLTIRRMINRNPLIGELFYFGLVATLIPAAGIIAPFLLMNCLSLYVLPYDWNSIWLWGLIHLVTGAWIALLLYGVTTYPEIDLPRTYGLSGYVFMSAATMVQGLLMVVLVSFLDTVRYVFLAIFYSQFLEQGKQFTTVTSYSCGPRQYFRQIYRQIPQESWQCQYPYQINYSFVEGLIGVVLQFRIANLSLFLLNYDGRLDRLDLDEAL